MRNVDKWFPTKYVSRKGKLTGSRNPAMLSVSSRLMADLIASFYHQHIPRHARGRLADLGCGNVPLYAVYKDFITENICVDWGNTRHSNLYLDVECDLNNPLPLDSASFDTIIISDVLEHIANPEGIWAEMARILKLEGKILLSVPFLYPIHEAPYDYYRYTIFALENFAVKNGLTILELKALGGLPEVLTDICSKNVTRLPVIGNFCAKVFQSVCSLFIRTGLGRNISLKTSKIWPLGYFVIVEKR